MAKETKNLLKKADCQRELFKSRSFRLRQCIPLAIILSLFLIPLSIGLFSFLKDLTSPLATVLVCAIGLICYIPILSFGYVILTILTELRMLKQGEIVILVDTVARIARGEVVRGGANGRYSTADALYFKMTGRYVPSKTVFDLTSRDDSFYVVFLSNQKRRTGVLLAYPTKLYECHEADNG